MKPAYGLSWMMEFIRLFKIVCWCWGWHLIHTPVHRSSLQRTPWAVADTNVTLISNLTLQPPNAFLMGPNTGRHTVKFLAVWAMIPHLPVYDAEFLGLCGAIWGCCSIMTPLVSPTTLSLDGSIKISVGFKTAMCAEWYHQSPWMLKC